MPIEASITLFREKSLVYRLGADMAQPPALEIRSNRVRLTVSAGRRSEELVVRGRTLPMTLRLVALVLDALERNPVLFSRENTQPTDWTTLWNARQNPYDRRYGTESWVSLHAKGRLVFASRPVEGVEALESIAHGGELGEAHIREMAARLLGAVDLDDFIVQHDSQTAVVFSSAKDYLRAALLDRRDGKSSSFAVSVFHPNKPEAPVGIGPFVGFCADIGEALALRAFHAKVKAQLEGSKSYGSRVPAAQVDAAGARKRDVMQYIVGFERAHRVTWRPERPEFF